MAPDSARNDIRLLRLIAYRHGSNAPDADPYGISGDLFLRGSLRLICGAQNEVCSEVGRKR
jgi:hypothetical protein